MSGKNAGAGTAKVADVKIKGVPNNPIDPVDVKITLSGGVTFKEIEAGEDATEWFGSDMSDNGLSAEVKDDVESGSTSITITVSGYPDHWDANALAIEIPKGMLINANSNLPVTENDDARYDIAMPIGSDTEFAAFVNEVNTNGKVTLSAVLTSGLEIDATTGVDLPIARDWHKSYQGEFNGNGGTIEIALEGEGSYLALFGVNNGYIHDFTVEGSVTLDETATDADYIAGVVAYNDIAGKIKRVINNASVTAYTDGEPNNAHNIGGIAGFNGWDPFNDDSTPPPM
jgi:hypothetical protein